MNSENPETRKISSKQISIKEVLLELTKWWYFLLSKWFFILTIGILGGLIGFAYAYFRKPTYTAVTTFVLEDEKSGMGLGSIAGLASIAGIDLGSGGGGIFQGDNILELYKSRKMIEKTLLTCIDVNHKKQLLIDRYIDFNALRDKWAATPELKSIAFPGCDSIKGGVNEFSRLQDSVIGVIVKDINKNYLKVTKLDKKLSLINAQMDSKDEIFAKNFNEQIVKNVNDFYLQTKTKKAKENVAILQHKTDSVRNVMNGAIYSAAAIADATPNLNPTRQIQRAAPIQKSQFTSETNKAILTELVKNLELSKISLRKETPLVQVVDVPVMPLENDRLGKAKAMMIGGFLAGFLSVLLLTFGRTLKSIYPIEQKL